MNQAILFIALWYEADNGNISESGSESSNGSASESGSRLNSQSMSRSGCKSGSFAESYSQTGHME